MWAVSDAFLAQLDSNTRRWKTYIEVIYGSEIVTSADVLVSGYIGLDNQAVRRELHITLFDADGVLTPGQATDLLAPKGTEIRLYRGLYLPDLADYEYVPMGVFGIVSPATRANEAGPQIEIKGFDRLDKLRALQFLTAFPIADGTFIHDAIASIVTAQLPGVPLRVTTSTFTTGAVVFAQLSSPWDAISALCQSANFVFYFDPLGSAVIEPFTEAQTGITYETGPSGLLINSVQTWDNTNVNSGVIVKGANPDKSTFDVELWDTDPNSPTYSLGPFGQRPFGYYSEFITTTAQALAVAQGLFPRVTRLPQDVEIYTAGGPQHDVGDLITIIDPRTKINGNYTVKTATIPIVNNQGDHVRLLCQQAGLGGFEASSE
jgi:hypothetical protein